MEESAMNSRREFLFVGSSIIAALAAQTVTTAGTAAAQKLSPSMPARNPWLAESVYPTSHFNPAATDSVLFAGPVHGRKLAHDDAKSVPTVITSNPALKKLRSETIAFASGAVGY
jgi:hypothetical protein